MRFLRFASVLFVSLCLSGTIVAENRIFYPEGMQGLPGEDVTIYLMLETEEQLAGYGFSCAIDTTAFEFTLPDEDAFTWDGTAAESGNLPIKVCSYDPVSGAFGGFATTIACDPGVSPGEHVAINIHMHIKESALPGTYLFGVPYPPNPCGLTDCNGIDVEVTEYDGSFEVLAVLGIEAPDSIIVDEGASFAAPIIATDIDPAAEVCLWATQLSANATFDSTCSTGSVTSTFAFNPDYCQAGSYQVVFHARDEYGRQAQKTVPIVVNSMNRTPVMLGGPSQSVMPGDSLYFTVLARDMDYSQCGDDTITMTALYLPSGAYFEQDSDTTGFFSWPTTEEDTGTYVVTFVAEDLSGTSDSADVRIKVTEWLDSLIIADVPGCIGYEIEVPVYSVNYEPLYDYRVFIEYDHEVLEFHSVDTTSTSSSSAVHFFYVEEPVPGLDGLFISCTFDSTQPLPSGRNLLAKVVFLITEEAEPLDSTLLHLPPPGPSWPIATPNTWPNRKDGIVYFSQCFIRADADCSSELRMADVVYTLRALYVPESPELQCLDAADSNDDGAVQMADAVYALRALYVPESPPPPPPYPGCGVDPTPDDLDCQYHPCWRWPPEAY